MTYKIRIHLKKANLNLLQFTYSILMQMRLLSDLKMAIDENDGLWSKSTHRSVYLPASRMFESRTLLVQ